MKLLRASGNVIAVMLTAAALVCLLGVSVLPEVLGYKTYVVLSGSMEPAIHTGSILVALPVTPEALKVGDVIVYNRSDVSQSITHRIVDVDNSGPKPVFSTKGDANGAPDSWTVQYQNDTAGKIVLTVPFLGFAYHAVGSPQGRLVFLVVPVLVLSLLWLAQIWRPERKLERVDRAVPRGITPRPDSALPLSVASLPRASLPSTSKADSPPIPLRQ